MAQIKPTSMRLKLGFNILSCGTQLQLHDPMKNVNNGQDFVDDKIITYTVEKLSLNKQTNSIKQTAVLKNRSGFLMLLNIQKI
jgi:hypothetical protein